MRPGKLFLFAILIRLLFIILALLADSLSPDYDNSMMAESPRSTNSNNNKISTSSSTSSNRVFSILDPFMRWDAVHFRHIAKFGYSHEHLCAFFQQTPNLYRTFGLVKKTKEIIPPRGKTADNVKKSNDFFETSPTPPILNEIAFLCFHVLCFAFATMFLRSILLFLTDRVKSSLSQAGLLRPSLLVWLVNPASIFFTAAYTETYFALIAFAGMFCVQKMHFYAGYSSFQFLEFDEKNYCGNTTTNHQKNEKNDANNDESLETVICDDGEEREIPVSLIEKDYLDEEYQRRSPSPMGGSSSSFKNNSSSKHNNNDRVTVLRSDEEESISSAALSNSNSNRRSDDMNSNNTSNNNNFINLSDARHLLSLRQKTAALAELRARTPKPETTSFARTFTWSVAAALCFYVATTFRSNGILLAGFLVHFAICRLWFDSTMGFAIRRLVLFLPPLKNNNNKMNNNQDKEDSQQQQQQQYLHPVHKLALTFLCFGLSYLVTIPYQNHISMCYNTFCNQPHSDHDGVCSAGEKGFYSRIQFKYWKVGLFSYWTSNNIPNFIIALPTFLFVGIGLYFRIVFERRKKMNSMIYLSTSSNNGDNNNNNNGKNKTKDSSSPSSFIVFRESLYSFFAWLSTLEACHIVYLCAQLLFALLTMNVQVVTRFVAASPAVYYLYGELLWKCSILTTHNGTGRLIEPYIFSSGDNNDGKKKNKDHQREQFLAKWQRIAKVLKPLCFGFVIVWAVVGTAMFPNFMPWT